MSYGIIYDKQFVKVIKGTEELIMPFIYSGDNNCYEWHNGRERRSRSWFNQSFYTPKGEHMASAEYIIERVVETGNDSTKINSRYPTESQYIAFYKNAIKKALTLEQLQELGICIHLYIYAYDWEKTTKRTGKEFRQIYAKTTQELLDGIKEIEEYCKGSGLGVSFGLEGASEWNMKRVRNHFYPKVKKNSFDWGSLKEYFVLYKANYGIFVNRTKYKIRYSAYMQSSMRKFKSEKQAQTYADNYLSADWKPRKIINENVGS